MCNYQKIKTETVQITELGHCVCLFLLLLIIYAATTSPTRMETNMKKVLSSLTVPFGKIANNREER
jgi:hypothetical protein